MQSMIKVCSGSVWKWTFINLYVIMKPQVGVKSHIGRWNPKDNAWKMNKAPLLTLYNWPAGRELTRCSESDYWVSGSIPFPTWILWVEIYKGVHACVHAKRGCLQVLTIIWSPPFLRRKNAYFYCVPTCVLLAAYFYTSLMRFTGLVCCR